MDGIFDINGSEPKSFDIYHGFYEVADDKTQFWGGNNAAFSNVDINTGEILQTIYFKKNIGGNLWASLRDSDGNWWFGIGSLEYKRRIIHYNPTTQDSATVFVQYNDFETLKQAHIIQFLEDGPIIWASSNEGLIAIDKQKGVVGVYKKDAKRRFSITVYRYLLVIQRC